MNRRSMLIAALSAFAGARVGATPNWPSRPIRIVVPFPAGGAADVQARILAAAVSKLVDPPVIVENRSGAGGNIGALSVAKAEPDGYTLLMGTPGPLSINQHLYKNMQFDPLRDFTPVSFVSRIANVLVVNPSVPVEDVRSFIEYARAAEPPLSVGLPGKGSAAHLAVVALTQMTRIRFNHVIYRGSAPAIADLTAGVVPFMISEMPSVTPHVQAGRLRALAVTTSDRWFGMPELPTLGSVVPGFESSGWFAIVGPRGIDPSIVSKLAGIFDRALSDAEVQSRFKVLGALPVGGSPLAQMTNESRKWSEVIGRAGALIDQQG